MPIKELENQGPVKVTVTDVATGEVIDEKVLHNDYMVLTQGNRYVKSWQMWGSTAQFNIAVDKGDYYA